MARTRGRIAISKNPKDNLDLALKIFQKHNELGDQSPLNILEDIDWAVTGPKAEVALKSHDLAEFHKAESEKNYAERDRNITDVAEALRQSIALLKASFGNNPKKLADWGVNVDDSPKAKKPKPE